MSEYRSVNFSDLCRLCAATQGKLVLGVSDPCAHRFVIELHQETAKKRAPGEKSISPDPRQAVYLPRPYTHYLCLPCFRNQTEPVLGQWPETAAGRKDSRMPAGACDRERRAAQEHLRAVRPAAAPDQRVPPEMLQHADHAPRLSRHDQAEE